MATHQLVRRVHHEWGAGDNEQVCHGRVRSCTAEKLLRQRRPKEHRVGLERRAGTLRTRDGRRRVGGVCVAAIDILDARLDIPAEVLQGYFVLAMLALHISHRSVNWYDFSGRDISLVIQSVNVLRSRRTGQTEATANPQRNTCEVDTFQRVWYMYSLPSTSLFYTFSELYDIK